MNVAKRPSKPSVARHSKHKSKPAKPPSKPAPPRAGGGLDTEEKLWTVSIAFECERLLTRLDIVGQVVQYNDIPNVGRALELGAC